MTTHGDILIRNKNGKGMKYWLHAYSDGHASAAYQDLKSLPAWIMERSKLCLLHSEDRERFSQKKIGTLGPHQMILLRDFPPKNEESFSEMWNSNLGVNLDYCDAARIANLMVQRHFDRWNIIREQDAPWHKVGEEPDFDVVCDYKNGSYLILPSKDVVKGYSDTDEPVVECEVDFGEDLYEAFKTAVLGKEEP